MKLVVFFLEVRMQLNFEIFMPNLRIKLEIDNTEY